MRADPCLKAAAHISCNPAISVWVRPGIGRRCRCRRRRRARSCAYALPCPTRLQALRGIKNCVIGNKRQKLRYIQLGAVPLLVEVLAAPGAGAATDASQLVQAAAALGSFAASQEGLQVVLQSGGVPQLLRVLQSSGDDKVVEAAVRALKAVCRVRWMRGEAWCIRTGLYGRFVQGFLEERGKTGRQHARSRLKP